MEPNTTAASLESILLDTSKSVPLIDALKFFGGWHSEKEEIPKSLRNRFSLRRTVTPNHRLHGDEFLKTVLYKKTHGGHIAKVLVDLGIAKEEEIAIELSRHHSFPYLPLKHYETNLEAVKSVPEELAREYLLAPLDRVGNNLMIAMVNPLDREAIRRVEAASNCYVQVFVSVLSEVLHSIEQNYKATTTKDPLFS